MTVIIDQFDVEVNDAPQPAFPRETEERAPSQPSLWEIEEALRRRAARARRVAAH